MRIIIVYGTREGQTLRIAEHLTSELHSRGVDADLRNAAYPQPAIDWRRYDGAIVAASVHLGRHEHEIIDFVKAHRPDLERLHAAFVSVSLSERGAEDASLPAERRRQHAADVAMMIDRFVAETSWKPARVLPVAGALAYRRYNLVVRYLLKRIARQAGAPTDTSRNYEFTDWQAVDRFAGEISAQS